MGSYKSRQDRAGSGGSSSSTETDASTRSKSTAETLMSDEPALDKGYEYVQPAPTTYEPVFEDDGGPRDSMSTYASTTASAADLPQEQEDPLYEVDDRQEGFPSDAYASTPSSFAGLFPSSRRLLIRHDDATIDGNMNLRVDTVAHNRAGYPQDVILFHLRMYDLFSRKFSFRRYCRDSGREVCHTARKEVGSAHQRRPSSRRSWSSVLASLRPGSSGGQPSSPAGDLKRQDSGFEDAGPGNEENWEHGLTSERGPALADTILLEFSNYAHVELRRRGPGTAKRYEYEYWSTKYQWRRESRKEGDLREVSYYLVDTRSSRTIAHLVPEIQTPLEAVEEESKGGWVPPSSLWISDPSVYSRMPDVAE